MHKGFGVVALVVALIGGTSCGAISEAKKIKDVASGKTAKRIQDFEKRAEAAKTLTYTVDYEGRSKGDKPEKIHIAQKPPKSVYQQGDSTFIDDGKKTFLCTPDSNSGGKIQCLESGPSGANPQGFVQALSVTGVFAGLTALAIVPGITVKDTTRTIAGEKVDCVTVESTRKVAKGKFESCVTKDGILASNDDGEGNVFTMTSFKRSAADSEFKLPGPAVSPEDLLNQSTSTTAPPRTTTTTEDTTTTTEDTTTTTEDTTTTTGG